MNLEQARAWLTGSPGIAALQGMDDDAEAAVNTLDRNAGRMGPYPSSVLSEYRRAGTALNAAQAAFARSFNDITLGRATDGRAAMTTYRAYLRALLTLQAQNARYSAFIEADVARLLERYITAAAAFASSRVRRETRAMRRDLERLRDRLTRARRAATEAQVQRALNVVINGIGLVLGIVSGVEEVVVAYAFGSAVLSTALDFALGPGSPDEIETAVTGGRVVADVATGVPRVLSQFAGCAGTYYDWYSDNQEIATADRNIRGTADDLRDAVRLFRDYARFIASQFSDVNVAKRAAVAAIRDARSRARAFRESDAEYRDMMGALEDLR